MSVGTRPSRPSARARARLAALLVVLFGLVGSLGLPAPVGATGGGGPVSSANARYLAATYDGLLGRTIDEAGLDYQLNIIKSGGDRTRRIVAFGLLFSAEGSRKEVQRAYSDLLHRSPDAGGEGYWTTHLQGRGLLDLRVLLLASDEYHSLAGGSDADWLETVYQDVLGRPTDATGRAYWLSLASSGVPRPLIVAGVYLSDEALGRRVDSYYDEALDRSPTPHERTSAIRLIRSEGERGLRATLWASDERFERYLQPVVT